MRRFLLPLAACATKHLWPKHHYHPGIGEGWRPPAFIFIPITALFPGVQRTALLWASKSYLVAVTGATAMLGYATMPRSGRYLAIDAASYVPPHPLRLTNFRHKHVRALRANAALYIKRQRTDFLASI